MNKNKTRLRRFWRNQRQKTPKHRREEAAAAALSAISRLSARHRYILSYASFGDELSTTEINRYLLKKRQLILPRVMNDKLELFHVDNPVLQLDKSSWGFAEPLPERCEKADIHEITCLLVPGLAFDARHHRLGYGKGFYDRLLASFSHPPELAVGIGFIEQYQPIPLPAEPHDFPLTDLLLF